MLPSTYTVENVRAGHVDKFCDQVSDAVLDECLRQDKNTRAAVEVFGGHGLILVGGELTTHGWVNVRKVVTDLLRERGYGDHYGVITNIVAQSPDIAQGVDAGGAGDQGIMYGYATNETPELLPLGVIRVQQLVRLLDQVFQNKSLPWLGPDGKAQVTVEEGRVTRVLVSCQHGNEVELEQVRQDIATKIVMPIFGAEADLHVNPTGRYVVGGFDSDTGLTGRKTAVDTYGGLVPHGGGCFSGKDATKVDRSAAYMARLAAKSIVASGHAKECLVSVAYAIGEAEPLMLEAVNEKGESIANVVKKNFDFRPAAIIERLGLRQPIFKQTAVYGHFGREGLPWENTINL